MSSAPPPAVLAALRQFQLELLQVACITLGAIAVLLGVLLTQVVSYLRLFPRDRLAFKALVAALLVLQVAHFGIFMANTIHHVTDGFNQIPITNYVEPIDIPVKWLVAANSWLCEGYFTYLTIRVVQNWAVRITAVVLYVCSVGAFLGYNITTLIWRQQNNDKEQQYIFLVLGIWGVFAIAAFTSSVLVYNLVVKREIKAVDDVLTSILALSQGISAVFTLFRDSTLSARMAVFLASFYAVSAPVCVLWNLNHRAALRQPHSSSNNHNNAHNLNLGGSGISNGVSESRDMRRSPLDSRPSRMGLTDVRATKEETREEEWIEDDLDGTKERWRRTDQTSTV
ncbi:hypothetical protein JCM6882_004098 [Rhodosporidiobolus microsporus]